MHVRVSKSLSRVLALAFVALMPLALAAQVTATSSGKPAPSPSKWDIFAGYSALIPNKVFNEPAVPHHFGFNSIDMGAIFSVSRYFNRHVGITFEGDEHILLPEDGVVTNLQPQDDFSGGGAGIIYRIPTDKVTPFFHALFGVEQVGTYRHDGVFGPALTAGGGFDLATPAFNHHLSIRLIQGDYQYVRVNFPAPIGSQNFDFNGRVSAGLVWGSGSFVPPPPATLACTVSPSSIFPGDPVTVTASAGGLDPKLNAVYSWSGTGVTGTGTTVNVATTGLAAGSYTIQGTVKEGKPGKEGLKPGETANCTASFTVKAYEPPTVSCSASPSTIKPGEGSTITATGMSPQNRPLTYSYSASAGTISGTGTTASFSSAGAPTGEVGITCNVADDKGQTATASTSVTITSPYVAPIPHTQALCSISFDKDKGRPTRVDNEAKACLDQVALDLKNSADAKAVIVGEATAKEKAATAKQEKFAAKHKHAKVFDSAAQRAVNTKEYLVTDEGIDASRISVATGTTDGQTVENYLVPSGSTFTSDVNGTTTVDETVVKPVARTPLGAKAHHHKKAAAAKK